MSSRFDEAVEQILNNHVVEEGLWDTAKKVTKGIGRLAMAAAKPIASTALGFTPTGIDTGIKAVKNTAQGIKNVWRGEEWSKKPKNSKNTSSTPLNNLNLTPAYITTVARSFGGSPSEQTAMKTSLEAMLPRGGSSGYVSNVPVADAWNAVIAAAGKTQTGVHYKDLATNPALKSRFIAKLDSELNSARIDRRDIGKMKISVPAFFMTIPSSATNDQVNQAIETLG